MESITTINYISRIIITIIIAGSVLRVVLCAMQMMTAEDSRPIKKRIINIIIFDAVTTCIWGITEFAKNYYGG